MRKLSFQQSHGSSKPPDKSRPNPPFKGVGLGTLGLVLGLIQQPVTRPTGWPS